MSQSSRVDFVGGASRDDVFDTSDDSFDEEGQPVPVEEQPLLPLVNRSEDSVPAAPATPADTVNAKPPRFIVAELENDLVNVVKTAEKTPFFGFLSNIIKRLNAWIDHHDTMITFPRIYGVFLSQKLIKEGKDATTGMSQQVGGGIFAGVTLIACLLVYLDYEEEQRELKIRRTKHQMKNLMKHNPALFPEKQAPLAEEDAANEAASNGKFFQCLSLLAHMFHDKELQKARIGIEKDKAYQIHVNEEKDKDALHYLSRKYKKITGKNAASITFINTPDEHDKRKVRLHVQAEKQLTAAAEEPKAGLEWLIESKFGKAVDIVFDTLARSSTYYWIMWIGVLLAVGLACVAFPPFAALLFGLPVAISCVYFAKRISDERHANKLKADNQRLSTAVAENEAEINAGALLLQALRVTQYWKMKREKILADKKAENLQSIRNAERATLNERCIPIHPDFRFDENIASRISSKRMKVLAVVTAVMGGYIATFFAMWPIQDFLSQSVVKGGHLHMIAGHLKVIGGVLKPIFGKAVGLIVYGHPFMWGIAAVGLLAGVIMAYRAYKKTTLEIADRIKVVQDHAQQLSETRALEEAIKAYYDAHPNIERDISTGLDILETIEGGGAKRTAKLYLNRVVTALNAFGTGVLSVRSFFQAAKFGAAILAGLLLAHTPAFWAVAVVAGLAYAAIQLGKKYIEYQNKKSAENADAIKLNHVNAYEKAKTILDAHVDPEAGRDPSVKVLAETLNRVRARRKNGLSSSADVMAAMPAAKIEPPAQPTEESALFDKPADPGKAEMAEEEEEPVMNPADQVTQQPLTLKSASSSAIGSGFFKFSGTDRQVRPHKDIVAQVA